MACNGNGYCNAYGVGPLYCSGHRNPNSGTPISLPNIAVGKKVQVSDVNALKQAINDEIVVWNNWINNNGQSSPSNTNIGAFSSVATSTIITSDGETTGNVTPVLTPGLVPQVNWLDKALAQINLWTAYNTDQVGAGGYPGAAQATTKAKGATASNPGINVDDVTKVTAAQWNAIVSSYNTITQDCICNSDCACNAVCACYNDCGCNYSDERLKTNIILVDVVDGINVYEFNYSWNPTKTYRGVLAQELLNTQYHSAVTKDDSGFYMVDYEQLPVKMEELSLCTE